MPLQTPQEYEHEPTEAELCEHEALQVRAEILRLNDEYAKAVSTDHVFPQKFPAIARAVREQRSALLKEYRRLTQCS